MLNTTSPTFVPSAPNAFPCHTDPSSKTNLQGFWLSHGFEIAPPPAKHFKVAFLPPLDKEEKEVEHDDEADEEVFPTVEKFKEFKQTDAFNTVGFVAEHIKGLAFDDEYAHDDVVVRVPAEKG